MTRPDSYARKPAAEQGEPLRDEISRFESRMKFEVQLPSLKGIARLEVKAVQEGDGWAAYISFVSDRSLSETCLVLGQSRIPHRFAGASEKEVQEKAKAFLEQNYEVVRMIW